MSLFNFQMYPLYTSVIVGERVVQSTSPEVSQNVSYQIFASHILHLKKIQSWVDHPILGPSSMEYEGLKSTPLLKLATPKIFQTELENTPNFKNILSTCFSLLLYTTSYTTSDVFEINKGKGYKSWHCHDDVVVFQFQSRKTAIPTSTRKNTSPAFPHVSFGILPSQNNLKKKHAQNQKFQRFNLHDPHEVSQSAPEI